MKIYGLWDVLGQAWLGDNAGPKLYSVEYFQGRGLDRVNEDWQAESLTHVAADMAKHQLGRLDIEVREYDGTGIIKKDEIPKLMDGEEAIRRMEEGKFPPHQMK